VRETKIHLELHQAADLYKSGEIPWVIHLDSGFICAGRRYSRSRKDCRNSARWRWVADRDDPNDRSATLCWPHLLHHAGGSMEALNRLGLFLEDENYVRDDLFGGWYSP
jgi:hypothetical protein